MEGEQPNSNKINNQQRTAWRNRQQEIRQNNELLRQFNIEQNSLIQRQQELKRLKVFRLQQRQFRGRLKSRRNLQIRGLRPERIGRFQNFDADESMVGEQCIVCMNDLEIGTKMVRLDCHVDHYLCKVCADRWFKDHKTCPNCRHAFD